MKEYTSQWYLNHKTLTPWVYMSEAFSPAECQRIRELAQGEPEQEALVGSTTANGVLKESIRKNKVRWMNSSDPDQAWIFRKCTDLVLDLNQRFYQFDLEYLEVLQYTEYHRLGDFYGDHMDFAHQGVHRRKLSFSIQLTDPKNYEGSDLDIVYGQDRTETVPRALGTLIAFPSWQQHRVTELKKGQRESLVGWVCGPQWR